MTQPSLCECACCLRINNLLLEAMEKAIREKVHAELPTMRRFVDALTEIAQRSATVNQYTPDPVGLLQKIAAIATRALTPEKRVCARYGCGWPEERHSDPASKSCGHFLSPKDASEKR